MGVQSDLALQAIANAPPAAIRAVLADARIEVAALRGAADAVEILAMRFVAEGDDDAATACLMVGEQLQEGAILANAMLEELLAQYGSGGLSTDFLSDGVNRREENK